MQLRTGAVLAVLALLVVAQSVAHGQQPSSLRASVSGVSTEAFPNATALVSVDDSSGAGVKGLAAANFSVTIDGKPATVVSADLASSRALPLDVLLLMDASGSMAGGAITRVRESAKAFVAGLAPEDRVAITSFSDDVKLLQDFTVDRSQTQAAIDSLVATGNTALYQATVLAAQKMAASPARRRAVILLSDGAQDGVPLTVTREQALAGAGDAGVPFFTIGEGSDIDREYLQALAGLTRGRYLEAPNLTDIGTVYAGVGQLLRGQYTVTFDASAASPTGSTVVVSLRNGAAAADATVTLKPGPNFGPPPIVIDGVQEGDSVAEVRTVTVTGAPAAATVEFYVDDVNVFETASPPYTYTFDPTRFAPGAHALRVSTQAFGRPVEARTSFSSTRPAAKAGGGGLPVLPIAAGAAAVVLAVVVVGFAWRLRAMPTDDPDALASRVVPFAARVRAAVSLEEVPTDGAEPENIGEPMGVLISRAGTDLGNEYAVGGRPVSIGSGTGCGVRVDDPGLVGEEARIWVSKGHLMLHKMTKLTAMVTDGNSGGWQILDPGDTFEIGGHRFEFRMLPEASPQRDLGDVPNVLRDPDPLFRSVAPPQVGSPLPMPEAAQRSSFSDLMPRSD
jgi:VWFA-related protein